MVHRSHWAGWLGRNRMGQSLMNKGITNGASSNVGFHFSYTIRPLSHASLSHLDTCTFMCYALNDLDCDGVGINEWNGH
jgi:hypothetical protein